MKLTNSIKNILFIISLAISFSLSAANKPVSILTGQEFMGSDGVKHQLKDYLAKGKWTTVIVWGPKCPACIEEMPVIQSLYDDRGETNIDVLGLVVDFPSFTYAKMEQVKKFEDDYFITFPNLLISSNMFYDLGLGALQGTPTVILVDPRGDVSAVQLGGVPRDVIENYIAKQVSKKDLLSSQITKQHKKEPM